MGMGQFLMIDSERLFIRLFEESDAKAFYEMTLDDGFNLFPITIYRQQSVETAREWIRNNTCKYGVFEKSSGKLIGMGGLTPWKNHNEDLTDVTWRLKQEVWGKGYGMELAKALVNYGLTHLKLNNLTATITPDNEASKKIAEKLGMKFSERITLKAVPTDLYRL